MPTLQALGVHRDVCARVVIRMPNLAERNAPTNNKYLKPNTPMDLLVCPIDSIHMMDIETKRAIPITISQAVRLKREIARAHRDFYRNQNRPSLLKQPKGDAEQQAEQTILSVRERLQWQGSVSFYPTMCHLSVCPGLDELLAIDDPERDANDMGGRRGIPCAHVTEIVGFSGCGKTQLACSLCVNNTNVLDGVWILVSGGDEVHHAMRIKKLTERHPSKDEVMKKTAIATFLDEFDLLALLTNIESSMQQTLATAASSDHSTSFLIIVDSLCPMNSEKTLLDRIIRRLRFFSRSYSAAVVLINSISSRTRDKAAFGRGRQRDLSIADWRLHLWTDAALTDRAMHQQERSIVVRATVESHPNKREHASSDQLSCMLKVSELGVSAA